MKHVLVPTSLIPRDGTGPTVCSRHGHRATQMRPHRFSSRPPLWSYPLLLLGILPFVLVTATVRRRVEAPFWPVCASCRTRRRRLRWSGAVLFLGAVTAMGVGVVFSGPTVDTHVAVTDTVRFSDPGPAAVGALTALFLVLAGRWALARSGAAAIARGEVTEKGQYLRFRRPAAAFDEQVRMATQGPPAVPPMSPGYDRNLPSMDARVPSGPAGPGVPPDGRPVVPLEYTMAIPRIRSRMTAGATGSAQETSAVATQRLRPRKGRSRREPSRRRDSQVRTPVLAPSARHRR
jgi:hypothetical protein